MLLGFMRSLAPRSDSQLAPSSQLPAPSSQLPAPSSQLPAPSSQLPALSHELIIEPGRTEKNYWRDLWRYRELFYFLAWRDILVRYKQTVIGVVWALLRPFLTMVIFTVVFGRIAKLPSERHPVSDPRLRRHAAVAVLLHALSEAEQQPRRQRQPHLQNLLPAPHHPRRSGHRQHGRFLHLLRPARRPHALVRLPARLAHPHPASLHHHRLPRRPRPRPLPHRAERRNTATSASSSPSSSSSASSSPRSGSAATSFPKNGACSTRSTPWSASSTASAGPSAAARPPLNLPSFALSMVVTAFFLWLGIWYFRRTEKTFRGRDLTGEKLKVES